MGSEMESRLDREYNQGYQQGRKEALNEKPDLSALKARYEYLNLGGQWHRRTVDAEDAYLAGFEDAMAVLGVKP